MTETTTEKRGVNWGAIILALVAITAGRFVFAAINGDLKQEKPDGIVSAEDLGIDLNSRPIEVDVYNDGRIVVDGDRITLEELQSLIPQWKAARKIISYHREPKTESATPASDIAGEAIFNARLTFSPRTQPQRGEDGAGQPATAVESKSQ